jgi:hypothetical protein
MNRRIVHTARYDVSASNCRATCSAVVGARHRRVAPGASNCTMRGLEAGSANTKPIVTTSTEPRQDGLSQAFGDVGALPMLHTALHAKDGRVL